MPARAIQPPVFTGELNSFPALSLESRPWCEAHRLDSSRPASFQAAVAKVASNLLAPLRGDGTSIRLAIPYAFTASKLDASIDRFITAAKKFLFR